MNRVIALGSAVLGSVIVSRLLLPEPRRRLAAGVKHRMLQRMEHLMASLPEEAPPKLVMSVLPRLREQNEQILTLLREQNALLREKVATPPASAR